MSIKDLSMRQINKLKQEFIALSENGKGVISVNELDKLLREVKKRNNLSERDISRILCNADKDGSGTVEVHEFLEAVGTKKDREIILKAFNNRSAILKQFSTIDKQGKGYLTMEEFKNCLETTSNKRITKDKMEEIMTNIDKNHDGQSSACLDLARLNWSLVDQMIQRKVDLVVLEGMGRAVHTNFYANFNCECLKVAVLKNRWLAKRLGGDMFAVVFKYEIPPPKQTQET